MQGGTRKRGATWSYYFDMGKVDGKRQKKEKGVFKTKKEAEAALAKAISEYNNAGSVFEPSEITVADYLNQWFDLYCKTDLKYNTQEPIARLCKFKCKRASSKVVMLFNSNFEITICDLKTYSSVSNSKRCKISCTTPSS